MTKWLLLELLVSALVLTLYQILLAPKVKNAVLIFCSWDIPQINSFIIASYSCYCQSKNLASCSSDLKCIWDGNNTCLSAQATNCGQLTNEAQCNLIESINPLTHCSWCESTGNCISSAESVNCVECDTLRDKVYLFSLLRKTTTSFSNIFRTHAKTHPFATIANQRKLVGQRGGLVNNVKVLMLVIAHHVFLHYFYHDSCFHSFFPIP